MLTAITPWRQVFRQTERILALRQRVRAGAAERHLNSCSHDAPSQQWEQDPADIGLSRVQEEARDAAQEDASTPKFEMRTWTGPEGSRNYRLYVPGSLRGPPRALIVMLHGCKQDPEDFAVGTDMNALAEEHGLIVAYPSQARVDSPLRCWNWFRPGHQHRGEGEPAIIAGIARELMTEFSVERSATFVAGLSAGGAMAAIMGDCYPDLFSAVGVHSGLPCHSAHGTFSALALMQGRQGLMPLPHPATAQPVRTIVFQGTADTTVHPDNADRIAAAAQGGAEVEIELATGESEGGRGYGATVARSDDGHTLTEVWMIEGSSHGWSGGAEAGSYTDPAGPDASREMLRFFLET